MADKPKKKVDVRSLVASVKVASGKATWAVETAEPLRTIDDYCAQIKANIDGVKVAVWDVARGISVNGSKPDKEQIAPVKALDWLDAQKSSEGQSVILALNFEKQLSNEPITTRLLVSAQKWAEEGKSFVVVAPEIKLPPALERVFTIVRYALPDRACRDRYLRAFKQGQGADFVMPEGADLEALIDAGAGLTIPEFIDSVAESVIVNGTGRAEVGFVRQAKRNIIKQSMALDIMDQGDSLDDVGGAEKLKKFAIRILTNPEAKGLRKGIMIVGPPGTGKTMIARAIGKAVNMTVISWNISATLGGVVGQSEANIRKIFDILATVKPCIVFIDEIDKALSGIGGGGRSDGGVMDRLFGQLLTFMQDTDEVFWLVTANNPVNIPAPFFRSGRFDLISHLDLPSKKVRDKILAIYAKKLGVSLDQPLPEMENWTGAEIRSLVEKAKALGVSLMEASEFVCPVFKTARSEIDAIREWAKDRAKPADDEEAETANGGRKLGTIKEA